MLLVAAAAKPHCAAYLDRNVWTSLCDDAPNQRTAEDDIDHIRRATCRAGTHAVERWSHDGLRQALFGPSGTVASFCAAPTTDIKAKVSRQHLDEAHRALIGNASGCFNESSHVEIWAHHPGLESPFPEYATARHRVFSITHVNAETAILRAIRYPAGRVECDPKSMPL